MIHDLYPVAMEAEQLVARVQELTGRLEDLDDPAVARWPRS